MESFVIDVGTETEIDQRCGGCRMCLVYRLHVIHGVHERQNTQITVEIHQLDSTRRTLLSHHTVDIRTMRIEVI